MKSPAATRAYIELSDTLRHAKTMRLVRSVAPMMRQMAHSWRGTTDTMASVQADIAAARLHYDTPGLKGDLARLDRDRRALVADDSVVWDERGAAAVPATLDYAAILKPPTAAERGVIVVAFEHNFLRLVRHADIDRLARDYDLVVSPTWSPPFELSIMLLGARWPRRFFTMLSNFADDDIYPRFVSNAVPVPLLASSWVHPALLEPPSPAAPKCVDLVMLANFGTYKRHFALFRALRQLRMPLRVRLIGVPMEGRTAADMMALAHTYGVADQIEVLESPPDDVMRRAVQEAKAAVIMSKREGSCIAVAEMMMMNLPVLMLRDAHVGSKAFITPATGLLVAESELAAGLEEIVARAPYMTPRQSLLDAGIECFSSTKTLNAHLKRSAAGEGRSWTRDIVPHAIVRLAPTYTSDRDVELIAQAASSFGTQYGVHLPIPEAIRIPTAAVSGAP